MTGHTKAAKATLVLAPRWEELNVKVWEVCLEVENGAFVDIECIVVTEV